MKASSARYFANAERKLADATFWNLMHEGLPFDRTLADFLAGGYELKTTVDYGDSAEVNSKSAADALATARAFLAAARAVLEDKG